MIKKLNAIVGLICILCLCGHFGTMAYSLATGWYDYNICKSLAWATAITVSVHVVLVIIIFLFLHDGSKITQKKMNARVIVQRVSGIVMIVFLFFHVKNYGFIVSGDPLIISEKIRIIIMEAIFFWAVFSHISSSFSSALLSLGAITREKTYNRINIAVKIICGACFITIMILMIRFVGFY